MTPLSVYIHIPFCRAKCAYCDFLSYGGMEHLAEGYVAALCADIAAAARDFAAHEVVTVFFGGGTPTTLAVAQLARIMDVLRRNYRFSGDVAVSIESNPDTVDLPYLAQLRQMGINRISFGVQSFDARLLAALGRTHSPQGAVRAVEMAHDAGFRDINIDLMFALPHQSLEDFAAALDMAAKLPITHISCYSLTVEEGTPLSRNTAALAALPDEAADRAMYALAKRTLADRGFVHYEISNWARAGYVCRHNLGYWTGREYVGFGLGAHSYLQKRRLCKTEDLQGYINGDFACGLIEEVDEAAQMSEFVILGLRLISGIDISEFKDRFGRDILKVFGPQLQKLTARGLLKIDGTKIALTDCGIDLSNIVFADFL